MNPETFGATDGNFIAVRTKSIFTKTSTMLFAACRAATLVLVMASFFIVSARGQFLCATNSTVNGNTLTIDEYTGPGGDVVIPNTIGGLPVTGIGPYAFENNHSVTSVETTNTSIISIPNSTFVSCDNLINVNFPGVREIGQQAFENCLRLTTAAFSTNLEVGDDTFAGCTNLVSIGPANLMVVGDGAFSLCTSLRSASLTGSIGMYSFYNCSSLTNLVLGSNVSVIPEAAFWGCSKLQNLTLPSSLMFLGGDINAPGGPYVNGPFGECSSLTSIIIPDGIQAIPESTFYACTSLTNIVMPDSVTQIGDAAFPYCTNLHSLILPPGVTNIGYDCMQACSSLTNIVFPTNLTTIGNWAFSYCDKLENIAIPDTVTNLGREVFQNSGSLSTVTLSTNITSLGEGLFDGCTNLRNFAIGSNIRSIGDLAFFGCRSLTNIVIPGSVTNIDYLAFEYCTGLSNMFIPDNVVNLGSGAFLGCSNLTSVRLPAGLSTIAGGSYLAGLFQNCVRLANVTIPNTVTNIGQLAFSGCTSLQSINIPSSVTTIGESAFANCASLAQVVIPASVHKLAASTFFYCTVLHNLTIPNNVTSIDTLAFEGCVNLPKVTLSANVTNIGSAAFADCVTLTNISVDAFNPDYRSVNGILFTKDGTVLMQYPGGLAGGYSISNAVESIADYAFYGCEHLTGVTIPNSVTNIGQWAFDDCLRLTNVAIPASVLSIGNLVFRDCMSLQAIDVDPLNPAYSSIDGVLFNKDATALIQFPAGKLGNYAVPATVKQVGQWAFADCPGLKRITLPSGLTNIVDYAFWGCTNLTSVVFAGDAPIVGTDLFEADVTAQVYYSPGMQGWTQTFSGIPTVLWNPQIQEHDANFGAGVNGFGFNIAGSSNLVVVVEACTNLINASWIPVGTNNLASGPSYFSDPASGNFTSRFYRLSPP